ncbi:MAG: hypothetical protein WEE66_03020 [Actinomycetota bacterium]
MGQRSPSPAGELAFTELLRDRDRVPQVAFGLVEPAQLALADAAFGQRVAELPPSSELGEDLDAAVEVAENARVAATVVSCSP